MAKKKVTTKRHPDEARLKTSVALRPSIWRAARVAAILEGRGANEVLEDAVQLYLGKKGGR